MSELLDWNMARDIGESVCVSTTLSMCELDRKAFREYEYTMWLVYIIDYEGEYYELGAIPVRDDFTSYYDIPYMQREFDKGDSLNLVLEYHSQWLKKASVGELVLIRE